jgi:pimeloyl-ACP methyl ester carboxylesterase
MLRLKHEIKSKNGIDLMETVQIGGINQLLYFRGQNIENPAILYLHGGPASSEMQLLHGFQYAWEDDFTVIHWEQRQSGKTFLANDPGKIETATFERMLEDAWEVTQYIRNKLNKDKIIVLGHSWGSILGTALIQTHSDAISAYIGVAQIVDGIANEQACYNLAYEKANAKDKIKLEKISSYLTTAFDSRALRQFQQVRQVMDKNGVGAGAMKVAPLALTSPYYSLRDVAVMFGKVWNYQDDLFKYMLKEYNAENFGMEYDMPVFYIMGENDFVASKELAISFFEKIKAPVKQLIFIPEAGHMTATDNPKELSRVLLEEIAPMIK